ncbi:hypothetical protein ACH4LT_21075 [Streptomyces clavifer]|uniref:hypothetical protein n=1 Tax=Streptomyces clavifer TaxID=68188 RepID=UPI00379299A0
MLSGRRSASHPPTARPSITVDAGEQWLERPQHYDRGQAALHFGVLVARLVGHFATRYAAEQDTQDSSEYGASSCPGTHRMRHPDRRLREQVRHTGSGLRRHPGASLGTADAQGEGELDGADHAKINQALAELDYAVVAEELPESDYDGPSRLPSHVQQPSWWHRFFGIP